MPVRLFIGLFPQLRGAGRSESPARELCHGWFSKEINYHSCFLIHPLTPWFPGLTSVKYGILSGQMLEVEIYLCRAVKVTCQHHISPNDQLHKGKLPHDERSWHLWTTMLIPWRLAALSSGVIHEWAHALFWKMKACLFVLGVQCITLH